MQSTLEDFERLLGHQPLARCRIGGRHALDRICALAFIIADARQPREYARANLAASLTIANAVLQDAVEERSPFFGRTLAIAPRELQHRVLNDVERIVVVTDGDPGNAKRPLLYARQESLEFVR